MSHVNDRVIMITGAGGGFGALLAEGSLARGAKVVALDLSKEVMAERLGEQPNLLVHEADVRRRCDLDDAVRSAIDTFGGVDILVNNAGGPGKGYGSLEQIDRSRFDHTLDINLSSAYSLTHLALPLLRAAGKATIVNISSALAWMVDSRFAAYGAAKAGMEQMTRILAYELAPDIRVNAIAPGAIETPSTAFITANPEMPESTVRWIPQGRMGQPLDIALAALYLASPASGFVSGKVLEVDGGMAALPGSAIESKLMDLHQS